MKCKIYLSGAIRNTPLAFQTWRSNAAVLLENCSICFKANTLDPNEFFNYTDKKPQSEKQCLNLFMWLVDQSDLLLVNLDHTDESCGTCMEIERAYCQDKPIIAFGSKSETWYSWAVERSSVIFSTLEEAVQYIMDSYITAF